jgi:para-aminobenzoate synthetase / 4-amino-4-deoxychorismate lyase
LFDIERYPTVWQMTSTVSSSTDAPLSEIMAALFPCASITGAPKPRTMQIIASLETAPRGVYTGCIGFVAPGRRAQFNVAIRTVVIDRELGQAEYGVGGGIVWDSVAGDEYEECQVKARLLTTKRPDFSLLETLLWTPDGGYFLLDYHLRRLQASAAYWGFTLDVDTLREQLAATATSLPAVAHRVRLVVARDGATCSQVVALPSVASQELVRLRPAPAAVNSADPLLFHKTTRRDVYEAARAACPGADDVLLWNERCEVTETGIANVVAELGGELVTPPVACGLLAGTYRAWLLEQGKVRERVITLEALKCAEHVFVVNSVRLWREATVDWAGWTPDAV